MKEDLENKESDLDQTIDKRDVSELIPYSRNRINNR